MNKLTWHGYLTNAKLNSAWHKEAETNANGLYKCIGIDLWLGLSRYIRLIQNNYRIIQIL